MDRAQDVQARPQSHLDRVRLQRKQQSCRHRQGDLFPQRRRLPDAVAQGATATRSEIFRQVRSVPRSTTTHRYRGRTVMLERSLIGTFTFAAVLMTAVAAASAQDMSKYPDWSGVWRGDHGFQWDPTKRPGLAQQAPLTPEYQKIFEDSVKGQQEGSQ